MRISDWSSDVCSSDLIAPGPIAPRIEAEWQLEHGQPWLRHPLSRMAWQRQSRGARLFANGESFELPVAHAKRLAAAETLDAAGYARLSEAGRDAAFALYEAGHYRAPADEEE